MARSKRKPIFARWWYVRSSKAYYADFGTTDFTNGTEQDKRTEARMCAEKLTSRMAIDAAKSVMKRQGHAKVRAMMVTVRKGKQ